MSKVVTTAEYKNQLYKKWKGEYVLVGDYNGSQALLRIKHTSCGKESLCLPSNALSQTMPCRYCNPHAKKDTDIFEYQLNQRFPNEFTLTSEYLGANKPISAMHICGKNNTYEKASNLLYGIVHCPYCHKGSNQTTDSFSERIAIMYNGDYSLLEAYYSSRETVHVLHNICGYDYYPNANEILRGVDQCPVCSRFSKNNSRRSIQKVIDMFYDARFEMLEEYKTADVMHLFLCKECNQPVKIRPSVFIGRKKTQCPNCGDGISYPEKFFRALFEQQNIEYIYQFSCSTAKWCGGYRYDFYLPKTNWIIEAFGAQHFTDAWQSKEETQLNDIAKKETALRNGISKYIIIDCRISDSEYIKNQIMNSDLKQIISNTIDWRKCDLYAQKSIYIKLIDSFNSGASVEDAIKKYRVSDSQFERVIKWGIKNNLVERDYYKYTHQRRSNATAARNKKSVKCVETDIIYPSAKDAEIQMHPERSSRGNIAYCARGESKTAYGYHWTYV